MMKIDPRLTSLTGRDLKGTSPDQKSRDPIESVPRETSHGDRVELKLSSTISNLTGLDSESISALDTSLPNDRATAIQQRLDSGFYKGESAMRQAVDGILNLYSG